MRIRAAGGLLLLILPLLGGSIAVGASLDEESPPPLIDDPAFIQPLSLQDDFGFLAMWESLAADTTTLRPWRFAPTGHPVRNPLLARIVRRFTVRHWVREELGLRPDYFRTADSIAVMVDARADSLIHEEGVAAGVFYRSADYGGVRFLPPWGRNLAKRPATAADYAVDLETGRITRQQLIEGRPIHPRVSEPYGRYMLILVQTTSRSIWKEEIKRTLREVTQDGGRAGLKHITLPFEMPKAVKSILGEGKPSLSVSGSERITFGGRSQWFPDRPETEFRKNQSKFPQLEMQQDLSIRLKGSIGDKLDVDIDQSSQAQASLANRIKIHYRGYDDEIISKIDLGNTSLRLPGTEYVSYGGSHTGLFGINTEAILGPVTLSLILSKEEGEAAQKSTSIRSESQTKRIYDYEYIRDRFFFLDDPTRDAYPDHESWVVNIRQGSVVLWLDDGDGKTQEDFATRAGFAVRNLRSAPHVPADTARTDTLHFERLEHETDYWVYIDERFEGEDTEVHPYIVMNRYLDERATLGVTYYDETLGEQGEQVGGIDEENGLLRVQMLRPATDDLEADLDAGPWAPINRLMLKNVYSLHPSASSWSGQGLPENAIMEEGFELAVHFLGTVGEAEDPDELYSDSAQRSIKLIRYLGLDYFQQTNTGYEVGEDGQVDVRPWIDLGSGLIYFPDLQPFAPTDSIVDDPDNLRTYHLRGRPGDRDTWDELPGEYANRGIYTRKSCVRDRRSPGTDEFWQSRFYIEASYMTPVTELRVDAWDIIEGSEVVTAGGRRLQKDREYRIDYQTGIIKILDSATVGEDEEINVTYKRASAFGMASKTLVGAAAFYQPEDSGFSFSTSWLYERRGSPDRRPRLGSEPTRTAVGEVAAAYATESMGLTHLLDRLPLLDARRPSTISIEGGLGISFPNPNTRNDLYIDDFEGVTDDTYIQLNRLSWKPSGLPLNAPGYDDGSRAARRGELWWYTPYRSVREGDLKPTLDYQEAKDHRQVLELQFWPYASPDTLVEDSWAADSSWGGIVQGLSRSNLDLSRARFLDIWINDFERWAPGEPYPSDRQGVMYVEIGRVSEDALWTRRPVDSNGQVVGDPLQPPNGEFDTEDSNYDGQLDLSDTRDEDTGLDRVPGVDAAAASGDSGFDDYQYSADSEREYDSYPELREVYQHINGTEANGKLDTEDLDFDNSFRRENDYFQFRIDLSDTNFVETDVAHDYGGQEASWTIESDNGWRRIRVPLSDAFVHQLVGDPDWTEVKHLRIWFTGFDSPPSGEAHRLQIGGIEIRSNRWMSAGIRDARGQEISGDSLVAREEDFFPGVISNKENADVYYAPFDEHRDRSQNNVREKEQSLTLELRNFQPEHSGSVYMPFLRDQNYMGYEFLEFYLNSTVPEEIPAEFFLRLCKETNADSTHYYEYRTPVPGMPPSGRSGSWKAIKLRLTDLSDLKRLVEADTTGTLDSVGVGLGDGTMLIMHGRPNLTKIRRITMGIINTATSEVIGDANVWIDELRLTHVLKEVDYAYRLQLRTQLSDFAKIDLNFKRVGSDFVSISGGGFRTRKETDTAFSAATSFPVDRLLPRKWGVRMPFSFNFNQKRRVPKYRTNDDLQVGDNPSDRDITESNDRSVSLSLSRGGARNPLIKYTLDAISLSGSYKESNSTSPLNQDSTRTYKLSCGYSTSLATLGELSFYRGWKVRFLPTSLAANLSRGRSESVRYRRTNSDLSQEMALDDTRTTRSGSLNLSTAMRPIQAVTYNFKQSRNLMLKDTALRVGGLNLGTETSRQEDLGATYTIRWLRGWVEPSLNWKGSFRGNFNEQSSSTGGELQRTNSLTNSRNGSISGELPLKRLFGWISDMARSDPDEPAEPAQDADSSGVQPERSRQTQTARAGLANRGGRGSAGGGSGLLGNVFMLTRSQASAGMGEQSTFSRVAGAPTIAYQLGLSMDPRVIRLPNGRESLSKTKNYGMDADFRLLQNINVGTKWKRTISQSQSAGVLSENEDARWPEMDVRWGDLAKILRIKGFVNSLKATTRFTRNAKSSRQEGELMKREVNAQWGPLLDLNIGLSNGMTMTARMDYSAMHTEDLSGWRRESDRTTSRFSFSTRKNFSITREVTNPLTKKKERLTTRLDMGLTIKLDRSRSVTQEEGGKPQVMGDTRKFDFSLNGTYQFTKAVTGKATISMGENADNKNKTRTTRYVSVNLSAGFTF